MEVRLVQLEKTYGENVLLDEAFNIVAEKEYIQAVEDNKLEIVPTWNFSLLITRIPSIGITGKFNGSTLHCTARVALRVREIVPARYTTGNVDV